MRECELYGVQIVGGGRRRGGEGEEKGTPPSLSTSADPTAGLRLHPARGQVHRLAGTRNDRGGAAWLCRVGGPLCPGLGVPCGRSPRSAPGWGCRVGGPLALPRAGVPGGRSPVPRVAPAICGTATPCIHSSFLHVGVPTPCLPAALQALIDRILLDGEVSKAALEDDRLGGFREDDWLKPVLGA